MAVVMMAARARLLLQLAESLRKNMRLDCAEIYTGAGDVLERAVSVPDAGGKSVVLQLVVSPEILLRGLLLSLGMGALGGFLPALSAMRLRASFSRQSSSVRHTAGETLEGNAFKSAGTSSTRASVLVMSSPRNAGLPVSIS